MRHLPEALQPVSAIDGFEYFKAPEKTAHSYRGDWFTLGDMGRFDDEGFLPALWMPGQRAIGEPFAPQLVDDVDHSCRCDDTERPERYLQGRAASQRGAAVLRLVDVGRTGIVAMSRGGEARGTGAKNYDTHDFSQAALTAAVSQIVWL